jgi:hypothetical protein
LLAGRRACSCEEQFTVFWCVVPLQDDDEADEEGDEEERAGAGGVRTGGVDVDAGEEAGDDGIPVQEIDAYWLQRRVGRAFADIDPTAAQKLAEDTYAALQVGGSVGAGQARGWQLGLDLWLPARAAGTLQKLLLPGIDCGGMLGCCTAAVIHDGPAFAAALCTAAAG